MKVLHVLPNVSRSFGGPTESLIGYARAARAAGVDIGVAAPRPPSNDREWLRDQLPDATFHFFHAMGSHAFVVSPGLWMWLLSSRASAPYDIVHVHGLFNLLSSVTAWICCLQDRPYLIRPFGTLSRYTFSRRRRLKQAYFRLIDRPVLRRASGIHFTTKAEREEAARLSLHLNGRGLIVPPPLRGIEQFPQTGDRADRPTVLFLSRLHPKKNVSGLLKAWRKVVNGCPDARLWIAGDGQSDYVAQRKKQAHRLDLDDHVSFLGFVSGDEKTRVLQNAWAFVLPSHQENLGVAVLEAIIAGLPVVISPEVQTKSFVEQHDLGRVVSRDSSSLAQVLNSTLENEALQRQVAEQGPTAVEDTFSVDVIGEQIAEMYEKIVQQGSRK